MNIGLYQLTERLVNHSVAIESPLAGKTFGDYGHVKMAPTVGSPLMTRVQMALILYQQILRRESRFKAVVNPFLTVGFQGKTGLKGLMVTFA